MAHLEISGVSYPIPERFTYGELGVFKRIAKVRPNELGDALDAGDTDVIVALAVICLNRAGIKADEEKLMGLDVGGIAAVDDEEDEAEVPPADAAEAAAPHSNGVTKIPVASPENFGVLS